MESCCDYLSGIAYFLHSGFSSSHDTYWELNFILWFPDGSTDSTDNNTACDIFMCVCISRERFDHLPYQNLYFVLFQVALQCERCIRRWPDGTCTLSDVSTESWWAEFFYCAHFWEMWADDAVGTFLRNKEVISCLDINIEITRVNYSPSQPLRSHRWRETEACAFSSDSSLYLKFILL